MSFEQVENSIPQKSAATERDSSSRLAEDALVGPNTVSPRDFDRESTRVADLLNSDGSITGIRTAARALSKDLTGLSLEDSNDFLKQVKEKNSGFAAEHPGVGQLLLNDFNPNTGTWDKVTVTNGNCPVADEARIVQPGNTLWGIARDYLGENGSQHSQAEVKHMAEAIADESHIFDPSKISVGKAIEYPILSMGDYSREKLPSGDVLVKPPTIENLDQKELIMPSGEYLSIGTGLRYPGVSWSLHEADGDVVAKSPVNLPDKNGVVQLSDGAILHTDPDKWIIKYDNDDQITMKKQFDKNNIETLDVTVQRGDKQGRFTVKE